MELVKWQNETVPSFSQLFDEFFSNGTIDQLGKTNMAKTAPPVNIWQNENEAVIEVVAPGIPKSDLSVTVDSSNVLTISYEKTDEELKYSNSSLVQREFTVRSFSKSFKLAEHVKLGSVNANFENGILTVTIPKQERKVHLRTIAIK